MGEDRWQERKSGRLKWVAPSSFHARAQSQNTSTASLAGTALLHDTSRSEQTSRCATGTTPERSIPVSICSSNLCPMNQGYKCRTGTSEHAQEHPEPRHVYKYAYQQVMPSHKMAYSVDAAV